MIINKMVRIFFAIAVFWIVLIKGDGKCSLWVSNRTAAGKMPLAYTEDEEQQVSLIYPNSAHRLIIEYNSKLVLSCVSTEFALEALKNIREITVKCLGDSLLRYEDKTYKYDELQCQHIPWSTVSVTNRVCKPNNNTVVTVGFKTKNYYFTLYSLCFDMDNKNTLYTWYNVRLPYYDSHQYKQNSISFTRDKELYEELDVNLKYSKYTQRETLNAILNLPNESEKFINSSNYLTRGHLAAMTEFYYAREQRATFNYANATPQWKEINESWSGVEKSFREKLAKNGRNRRVIVTGVYGSCTLTDKQNVQRPLYLAMPEQQLAVSMFTWKLYYDADKKNIDVVYIGLNNPYATQQEVEDSKLRCAEIQCPWQPKEVYGKLPPLQLYCCTRESFERVFGHFDPEVFNEPRVIPVE